MTSSYTRLGTLNPKPLKPTSPRQARQLHFPCNIYYILLGYSHRCAAMAAASRGLWSPCVPLALFTSREQGFNFSFIVGFACLLTKCCLVLMYVCLHVFVHLIVVGRTIRSMANKFILVATGFCRVFVLGVHWAHGLFSSSDLVNSAPRIKSATQPANVLRGQ